MYRSRGLIRFLFLARTHARYVVVRKGRPLGIGLLFGFDQLVGEKRGGEEERRSRQRVCSDLVNVRTYDVLPSSHGTQPVGLSMARRRITYAHGFPAKSALSPFLYRVPPAIDSAQRFKRTITQLLRDSDVSVSEFSRI